MGPCNQLLLRASSLRSVNLFIMLSITRRTTITTITGTTTGGIGAGC